MYKDICNVPQLCKKRIEERDSAYETTEKKETEQSSRKSQVIYWLQYAEDFYSPVEKQPLPDVEDDERLKIVFTGNIGYAQGLDILPKVAELLKRIGRRFDSISLAMVDTEKNLRRLFRKKM